MKIDQKHQKNINKNKLKRRLPVRSVRKPKRKKRRRKSVRFKHASEMKRWLPKLSPKASKEDPPLATPPSVLLSLLWTAVLALTKKFQKMKDIQDKSKAATAAKLNKLRARQEKINAIQGEVKQKIQTDELAKDPEFLKKLIVQGCMMLLERNVQVKCREADKDILSDELLQEAEQLYAEALNRETQGRVPEKKTKLKLTLSEDSLPEGGLGGVICSCKGGDITVNNTIEARMNLVLDLDKPAIRKQLFRD